MSEAINDVIYTLTMEDVDNVLDMYDEETRSLINKTFSREDILNVMKRKLEINHEEAIAAVIDVRLLAEAKLR